MSNMTRRGCTSRAVRARDLVALIALTGATLGAVGCGSSGTTAPQTGSLTVTIAAPAGVTPSVTVSGPGGYTKALSATTTLTGLASGSYSVTAAPVTIAGAIVSTVSTANIVGSPATVTGAATAAATVTYVQRPGSGGLWVSNHGMNTSNGSVLQYAAGQLGSSTSALPATAIGTGPGYNGGLAFDANGNLWVADAFNNVVVEYSVGQLSASGTPTPTIILGATAGSLSGPTALAFDASGNLWVANQQGFSVVEFAVGQLASSGSPTPAVAISASSGSLALPSGLAFDASGNLWVANALSNSVVEFASSQLVASGNPTPAVTIGASSNSLSSPLGLAFDASGNLWVASSLSNRVVEYSPSELTATGSPLPALTLTPAQGAVAAPAGLAFDGSGDLWVAGDATGDPVVEFTATQLVVGGTQTPSVTISVSSVTSPFGLAFDPHAAGLPLKP